MSSSPGGPLTRIRVLSSSAPQGRWMLVPPSAAVVRDVLHAVLSNLGLPKETVHSVDLLFHGSPLLLDEHVAVIRDGDTFEVKLRESVCESNTDAAASKPKKPMMKRSAVKRLATKPLFTFSPKPRPAGSPQTPVSVQKIPKSKIAGSASKRPRTSIPLTKSAPPPARAPPKMSTVPAVERCLKFAAPSEKTSTTALVETGTQSKKVNQTKPPPTASPLLQPPKVDAQDSAPLASEAAPAVTVSVPDRPHVKDDASGRPAQKASTKKRARGPPQKASPKKHVHGPTQKVNPAPIVRKPRELARKVDEPLVSKTATSELEQARTATQHCKAPAADDKASSESRLLRRARLGRETPESKIARMRGIKGGDVAPTSRIAVVNSNEKQLQEVAPGKGLTEHRVIPAVIHPVGPWQSDEQSAEQYGHADEEQLRFAPGADTSMAEEKPHAAFEPSQSALQTREASTHEVPVPMQQISKFAPSSDGPVFRQESDMTATPVSTIEPATAQRILVVVDPAEHDLRFAPASDDPTLEVLHAAAETSLNAEHVAENLADLVRTPAQQHAEFLPSSDSPIIEEERPPAAETSICATQTLRFSNEKMAPAVGVGLSFVNSAAKPRASESLPRGSKSSQVSRPSDNRPTVEPSLSVQDEPSTLDKRVRFALPRCSIPPHEEASSSADPLPSSPPTDHSSPDSEEGAFASPFAGASEPNELAGNNTATESKEQIATPLHPDGFSAPKATVMEQEALQFVPSSSEPEGADAPQSEKSLSHIPSLSKEPVASELTVAVNTPVLFVQASNEPLRRKSVNEAEEPKRTVSVSIERRVLKSLVSAKTDQVGAQSDVQRVQNDEGATRASTKLQSVSPNRKFAAADETRTAETPREVIKNLGESQLQKGAVSTLEAGKRSPTQEQSNVELTSHRPACPGVPLGVANVAFKAHKKRKRCLSAEGKRKRNARNRRHAKRKREEAHGRSPTNNVIENNSQTSAINRYLPTSPSAPLQTPPSNGHSNHSSSPGHAEDKNGIQHEKEAHPDPSISNTKVQDVVKVVNAKNDLCAMKMKAITEIEEGQCSSMAGMPHDRVSHGDEKLQATVIPEVRAKTAGLNPKTSDGKACKSTSRIMQGSVAAALQMARSHGVLESCKREPQSSTEARTTVSKAISHDSGKAIPHDSGKEIPIACAEEVSSAVPDTLYFDTSSATEHPPAKKRKMSKRARTYLDEEQYNESFFVGFEDSGGIPLPSPDLLNLFESPADSIRDEEFGLPKGTVRKEDVIENLEEIHVKEEKATDSLLPFRGERKEVRIESGNKGMARPSGNHVSKGSASIQTGLSSRVSSKQPRVPEVSDMKGDPRVAPKPVSIAASNGDVEKANVSNGKWKDAKEDPSTSRERRQSLKKDTSGKTGSASTAPHSIVAKDVGSWNATATELKAGPPQQKEPSRTNVTAQQKYSRSVIPPKEERHKKSRMAFQESKHLRLSGASRLIQRPPPVPAKPKVREWQSEYLTTPAGKVLNTSPFSDRNEPGQSATRDDLIFSKGSDFKTVSRSTPKVAQDETRERFPDRQSFSNLPDRDAKPVTGERQSGRKSNVRSAGPSFSTKDGNSKMVDHKDPNPYSRTDLGSSATTTPHSGRRSLSTSIGVRSSHVSEPRAHERQVRRFPSPGTSTEGSYRANLMQTLSATTNAVGRFCKERYKN